jgi:hypothetical protein
MASKQARFSGAARRARILALLGAVLCLALAAPGPAALAQEPAGAPAVHVPAVPAQGQAQMPAVADTGVHIQALRVQVMPEFDNPRVLVVVQGRLAASDRLPAVVTFRLPLEATINQMAVMSMDGGSIAQDYEARPDAADPRWLAVSYTLTNAHFFYEYYYDPLGADEEKQFAFTLNSLYPVEDLLLEVQEPARASGFQVEPQPAGSRLDGSLGLTYHQIQVGQVPAGEDVGLAVRYTKADPTPSLSWQQVMALQDAKAPVAPVMAAAPAAMPTERDSGSMLALMAGASLALIVMGTAYAAWRTPRRAPAAPAQRRARYCPGCGSALRARALYCHSCGAPRPTPRTSAADSLPRDATAGCPRLEVRL